MTRTLTLAMLLVLSMDHGHCQGLAAAPAFAPAFEVASITPCKPGTPAPPMEHTGMAQFTAPGGRFNARATSLKFLLEWAWGIQPAQHSGGPSWIDTERYDIVAKADGNATDDQMRLMMRTLLGERFQLQVHYENRKIPVYVVSVGKAAPRLFPAKEEEAQSMRFAPVTGLDQKNAFHIVFSRFSLRELTDMFARQLGMVIVDKTGLGGEFDFSIDLTPDESRPNPMDASLLISAMREQLRLAVTSEKAAMDILVIDRAERVAAGNE